MQSCISEATTMSASFAEDVEACSAAGCPALEVWLTKLETHLASNSLESTKAMLAEKNVALAGASYQGGLLLSQGESRKIHFDHFKKRLDLCQSFGIPTMMIVADFVQKIDSTQLQRAVVSLKQAAQWAAGYGVTLALEFRGADTFCASLDTALTLSEQTEEKNVGVCLDLFHFYKGPSKSEDLELLTRDNLAFVQLCDVSGVPRELMSDSDRVLPGEGDFRFDQLLQRLRAIDYCGFISVELFNPLFWQLKASQVSELAYSSVKRLVENG